MAEKQFQIAIQTTADTSGAKQAQDALSRVTKDAEEATKTAGKVEEVVESLDKKYEIDIEIKTDADTAGAEKAKEALTQLAQEAERTVRIVDNSIGRLPIGPRMEDGRFSPARVEAVDYAAQARVAQDVAMYHKESAEAISKLRAEIERVGEVSEEVGTLEAQRAIMAEQMLEMAEAALEGDKEGAQFLAREIEIRRQALALQRQLNISEAEALQIATQKVAMGEKDAVNWKRVEGGVRTVAGQLINGHTSLSSWSNLLSMINPQFAAMGLAAAGAAKIFKSLEESGIEAEKRALSAARRVEDLEKFRGELDKLDKLGLERTVEAQKEAREKINDKQEDLAIEGNRFLIQMAKTLSESDHPVDQTVAWMARWVSGYGDYLKKTRDLPDEFKDNAERIALAEERLGSVTEGVAIGTEEAAKRIANAQDAIKRSGEEIASSSFDQWSKSDQLVEYVRQLDKVRQSLRDIGVEARDPMAALQAGLQYSDDVSKVTVAELAAEWAKLQTTIVRTGQVVEEDAKRRTAEMAKFKKELEELELTMERLRADRDDMVEAGNSFLLVETPDWRGGSTKEYYREGDTTRGPLGDIRANFGAVPVAANDADLVRWQDLNRKIETSNQQITAQQGEITKNTAATAAASESVAKATAATAESADGVAVAVQGGMQGVQAALGPIPEMISAGAAAQVQQLERLNATLSASFNSMLSAVERTNQTLDRVILRVGALERRSMV